MTPAQPAPVPPCPTTGGLPPGARVLPAGGGEVLLVLETGDGALLHCLAAGPLPDATVTALPERLRPTVALAPAVAAQLAARLPGAARPGHRVLITGGARSGKSELAERFARQRDDVLYLAAGPPASADDPEWAARVASHQARRPERWRTAETSDAAAVLTGARGTVLFDCVGTWLTAAMDACGLWEALETGGAALERADAALGAATGRLVEAFAATGAEVVAVTNEVGSGVVPATPAGRRFRDELGRLNRRLAAAADEVWLCTVGIGQRIR